MPAIYQSGSSGPCACASASGLVRAGDEKEREECGRAQAAGRVQREPNVVTQ